MSISIQKTTTSTQSLFQPQKNHIEKSFHHFIPRVSEITGHAWERIKSLFIEESKEETDYLKKVLESKDIDWSKEQEEVAKILSKANPYGAQGHILKNILKRCDSESLNSLLHRVFDKVFDASISDFQKILEFLDSESIQKAASYTTLLEDMHEMAECLPPQKMNTERTVSSELIKTLNVVARFFPSFLDMMLKAFNLIEAGKGPESVWDFAAMLEIYFKIFLIPHGVFVIVGSLVSVTWQLFLITALIILGCVVGICFYIKYRPCPNKLLRARNLSEDAELGTLEPVIGREKEINKIGTYLGKKNDGIFSNIILVGEPGVGKTELVKGVAQQFKEKIIFALNAPELTSGYTNSAADLLRLILLDIKGHENEVVFFLDELGEAMKKNPKANLSGYLKPLLGTDGVQFIAAVTSKEYTDLILPDKALADRFTKVEVKPTTKEQTVQILEERKDRKGKSIRFEEGIENVIFRETKDKLQPRNAVKLLDLAINRVSAFDISKYIPVELLESQNELEIKQKAYQAALKNGSSNKKEIAKNIYSLKGKIKTLQEETLATRTVALKTRFLISEERAFVQRRNKFAKENPQHKMLPFLHSILLPWMNKKIDSLLKVVKDIPMQVDSILIEQMIKEGKEGSSEQLSH
jgi:ATP-dependent Clp protease ATP-binding subunit ClpA